MFRAEMLCSDEFYFQVLKRFAALPEHESLVGHISKEKGEDRWLTLLLIEMADKMVPKGACASTLLYCPVKFCIYAFILHLLLSLILSNQERLSTFPRRAVLRMFPRTATPSSVSAFAGLRRRMPVSSELLSLR